MGFLVACKNEEDPIKNEGTGVVTTLFTDFQTVKGHWSGHNISPIISLWRFFQTLKGR